MRLYGGKESFKGVILKHRGRVTVKTQTTAVAMEERRGSVYEIAYFMPFCMFL